MLSLFFLANACVTAVLISVLEVQHPRYHAIPWIFGTAFVVSCLPWLRHRMTNGAPVWRALPVLVYAGVITLASSVSPLANLGGASNVFHPVEYAGLAILGQFVANGGLSRRPRLGRVLWVAAACLAMAVLDEAHQSFVPARTATVGDVVLDALGVVLGTALFLIGASVARPPGDQRPRLGQELNE